MRRIPKTFNIEMDLLIYIEKKGREIGKRKDSDALNRIVRQAKEAEEESVLPEGQSKISIKKIKAINEEVNKLNGFGKLTKENPKLFRECREKAVKTVERKFKPKSFGVKGWEKDYNKYLKRVRAETLKLMKEQLEKKK